MVALTYAEKSKMWRTVDEKNFINDIGSFVPKGSYILQEAPEKRHVRLLKLYIGLTKLKARWGLVNSAEVIAHAKQRLKYYNRISKENEK